MALSIHAPRMRTTIVAVVVSGLCLWVASAQVAVAALEEVLAAASEVVASEVVVQAQVGNEIIN